MKETIKNNDTVWNKVQPEFQCCGIHSPSDWGNSSIPQSCCKTAGCNTTDPNEIYKEGCLDKFTEFVKEKIVIIGGIGIGLAFVQVRNIG